MTARTTETRQDRLALAAEAGLPRLSLLAVVAGVLVAYGAFAVMAAIAGAVLKGAGVNDVNLTDWNGMRGVAVAVGALVLFVSWLFGGYVAGRLARRSGVLHGLVTFVLGVLVAAGIAAAVSWVGGLDSVQQQLRSVGVPTSGNEWRDVASIAGAVCLAAMLLGSLLGGAMGERWYTKVSRRVADPSVGAGTDRYVTRDGSRDDVVDDRPYRDEVDVDRPSRDETVTGTGEYVADDSTDRGRRTNILRRARY